MPFTLAHPIAALPIWWGSRQRLDLPAMMVGSLMPDLSYYVHLQPVRNSGHTLLGALQEGVPWGFVLLLVSAYWVKRPCLTVFPALSRVYSPQPYTIWPWPRLITILLSLYIGAVSHIGWDGFTHRGGWAVMHWPVLTRAWGPLPIYAWLQYGGGVLGLASLLAWAFYRYWRSPDLPKQAWGERPSSPKFLGFRLLAAVSILSLSVAFAHIAATLPGAEQSFKPQVVRAVIGSVTGGSLGLLVYSICFWAWVGARQLQG